MKTYLDQKISVVVPTRNRADLIEMSLNSLKYQTHSNLEIIVVDDNSEDNTKEIVERFAKADPRFKYYFLSKNDPEYVSHKTDRHGTDIDGGFSAVRYGWRRATGMWVTKQDSDDFSLLNRIEIQVYLANLLNASHLTTGCFHLKDEHLNKKFNLELFLSEGLLEKELIRPNTLASQAKESLTYLSGLPDWIWSKILFDFKRNKLVNRYFFKNLDAYPGAGNNPLILKSVVEKFEGRHRDLRRWPSLIGRGWDRDHNFNIALNIKNSYVLDLPLYAWRTVRPFDHRFFSAKYLT